jgi:hypothetical protein
MLDVVAEGGQWELHYTFNGKTQAVIPLGNEPAVVAAALDITRAFNAAQPEEP